VNHTIDPYEDTKVDENMARLVKHAEPPVFMPRDRKASILQRLFREMDETGDRHVGLSIGPGLRVAVPAILILLAILFLGIWPTESPVGVTWADVIQELSRASTLQGRASSRIVNQTGEERTIQIFFYYRDPGLSREEVQDLDSQEPSVITIRKRGDHSAEELILIPGIRSALHVTHIYLGERSLSQPPQDYVAESLRRLKQISSDEARAVGTRDWKGETLKGFRASLNALFPVLPSGMGSGTLHVWVSPVTTLPVLVELDFLDSEKNQVYTAYDHLEWNRALDEAIFRMDPPDDYQVKERKRIVQSYSDAHLAKNAAVSIGLEDAPEPILSRHDILRVSSIEEVTEEGDNSAPPLIRITLELRRDSADTLRNALAAPSPPLMIVNWNDEERLVINSRNLIATNLTLDLSRLGQTAADIETRYIENARPEVIQPREDTP